LRGGYFIGDVERKVRFCFFRRPYFCVCFRGSECSVKEGSGNGPLHRGPAGGPGGEVLLPWTSRDSKRGFWKRGVCLSMGGSARGTWMEGSFTWDPEGCIKNGSGNGRLSTRGPRWGTREGTLLYRGFSEIYQEALLIGKSEKYLKIALEKGNSLHRCPVG